MASIIKYVRNRNPLSSNYDSANGATNDSSDTPYLNLEESISVDKTSTDIHATQYSSTSTNNDNFNSEPKTHSTPDVAADTDNTSISIR